MKNKTLKLTLRIILLGVVAMTVSYLPELYPNLFGDWLCEGSGNYLSEFHHFEKCDYAYFHNPIWHWGYRHWVYLCMCIVLLFVQIIDIIEY